MVIWKRGILVLAALLLCVCVVCFGSYSTMGDLVYRDTGVILQEADYISVRYDPVNGRQYSMTLAEVRPDHLSDIMNGKRARLINLFPESSWKAAVYLIDVHCGDKWAHLAICTNGRLSTGKHTYLIRKDDRAELIDSLNKCTEN